MKKEQKEFIPEGLVEETTQREKRKGFTFWPLDFRKYSYGNLGFFNCNETLEDQTLGEYLPKFLSKHLPKKYSEMHLPAISLGLVNTAEYTDNAIMIGLVNYVDGYDTDDYVSLGLLNIIADVPSYRAEVSTRFRPLISLQMSYDGKLKHQTWEEKEEIRLKKRLVSEAGVE